jgi:3',5'-cyclic AMP phosphodiesterase CpdA/CheY-like chemotaxis protein
VENYRTVSVLWAEDTEEQFRDGADSLSSFLKERGILAQFTNTINGGEAFKYLDENSYDLLIMDLEMPRFPGLEVLPQIHRQWPGMPIIVISVHANDLDKRPQLEGAVSAGMIRSFFHTLEPRDAYGQAVLEALTTVPPHILHLSDLHFGRDFAFYSIAPEELISEGLPKLVRDGPPNLLVISGDFASSGSEAEFSRAREFILALCMALHIPLEHVVIVPGNHDIDRSATIEARRFSPFIDFLVTLYSEAGDPTAVYSRYPELFDFKRRLLRGDARNCGGEALYSVAVFDRLRTVVIGLNSVVAITEEYELGRIRAHQLLAIGHELSSLQGVRASYLKVAVLHHNVFVVPSFRSDGEPDRLVRNPALVLHHLIDNGVSLILHGHTHYSIAHEYRPYFLDEGVGTSGRIYVVGCGTFGAAERAPSQPYAHATTIHCKLDRIGSVTELLLTPFRLRDERLSWTTGKQVQLPLVDASSRT